MKYSFFLHGPRTNSAMHFTRMEKRASGIIVPQALGGIIMHAYVEQQPAPHGLHIPEASDPIYHFIEAANSDPIDTLGNLCEQPHHTLDRLPKASIAVWEALCANGPAILRGKAETNFIPDGNEGFIATDPERDAIYAVASYVNTYLMPQQHTPPAAAHTAKPSMYV